MRAFTVLFLSLMASPIWATQLTMDSNNQPQCYNGYAFDALAELIATFPEIDESEALVIKGTLTATTISNATTAMQTYLVPPCPGNTEFDRDPTVVGGDFEDYQYSNPQNSINFSCFESMAHLFNATSPVPVSASAPMKTLVAQAEKDALKRAQPQNKNLKPVSFVRAYAGEYLMGIKVALSSGEDDEYGDYFLYTVNGKNQLELLSAHWGDDQGPQMKLYCTGWSQGLVIQ